MQISLFLNQKGLLVIFGLLEIFSKSAQVKAGEVLAIQKMHYVRCRVQKTSRRGLLHKAELFNDDR